MPTFNSLQDDEKIELWAMLSLQCTPTLTPILVKRILSYYNTATDALKILSDDPFAWEHIGIKRVAITHYLQQEWKEKATVIWKTLPSFDGLHVIPYTSSLYPSLLKNIADPPCLLYCYGEISLLSSPAVAIIGSRKASSSGKQITHSIASTVAFSGLTVISGLAEGIDTIAHKASLEHNATIAVLGTGIDIVYPPKNKALSDEIKKKGCLVSEFSPGTSPKPYHFPIRNRIITGLSLGVLVVEASLKSGSLVTAKTALDQGKEIYVVPPQYTHSSSLGTLQLLENGAKPILDGKDLFEDILPQISDSILSPAVRAKLLEYQLSLSAKPKDYYQDFLQSIPSISNALPNSIHTANNNKKDDDSIFQNPTISLGESYFENSIEKESNKINTHLESKEEVSLQNYSLKEDISNTKKPSYEKILYEKKEEEAICVEKSLQKELIHQSSFDIQHGLSPLAEKILYFLHVENKSAEELFDLLDVASIDAITTELIMLEIQSFIQKKPGGLYGIFYK